MVLKKVQVVVIVDRLADIYNNIDGIPVISSKDLAERDLQYDYLVVTVNDEKIYKEIIDEAISIGIDREIILPLRIFKIPFFTFEEYVEIKKSNISIVSDFCLGGFLYHKFGLKFLSPTINMFTDNENYYRFISNIRENMYKPLVKVENCVEDEYAGLYAYPRGRVGDAEWVFNHYVDFEAAEQRWKKGVERFNWDNYLVIMTIRSDEMAYKFDSLPIENKMGFYWKDLGLESVVYMPEWKSTEIRAKFGYNFSVLANRAATETTGIRSINWMKALLHKDGFRRIE